MQLQNILISASLVLLSSAATANPLDGLVFSHHDWLLACDNTRTCRAAGYHPESDENAVSVLITRQAGPNTSVRAQVMLGDYGESTVLDEMPSVFKLKLSINGESLGEVLMHQKTPVADLSDAQLSALLKSLIKKSHIEFSSDKHRWQLSDRGAAAVLLKMDDFQGRVGTPGALTRKGKRAEESVLAPLPMPMVRAASLVKPQSGDEHFVTKHSKILRAALKQAVTLDDFCPEMTEALEDDAELQAQRLSDTKMLVSALCWGGAYSFGYGYWVVDANKPENAVLVTTSGSYHSDGLIRASHKSRGLGDCWTNLEWTWDGQAFVPSAVSSTGMCRLMSAGGAWSLPTLITEVVEGEQGKW